MPTFLLWNVQEKPLEGLVVRLVQQHRVHVLILVERPEPDDTLLRALNGVGNFVRVPSHERFGVYTRFSATSFIRLTPPVACERVDFWRVQPRRAEEILLVAVHGLDRINNSEERQALFFERVAVNVAWAERTTGHRRTVVLGDFNANPYEQAVGGINGLHAIRMKEIAGRSYRTVMKKNYEFFYNPMWACYGAARSAPPATYYWNGSDVHEVFWHMIDQVVLRPDALPLFPENRLRILRQAGPVHLVTSSGFPDRTNASDHLPILFDLHLRRSAIHD